MHTRPYWIEHEGDGRLAISPRPRGGDWLEEEIQGWSADRVTDVASLLTPSEERDLELVAEADICRRHGIKFHRLPIEDRGIPTENDSVRRRVDRLVTSLRAGGSILIHCRQGIGRASMIAAAVLVELGDSPAEAWQKIGRARGIPVPETVQQKSWLGTFATRVPALEKPNLPPQSLSTPDPIPPPAPRASSSPRSSAP